jgi:hypothetical protein
MKTFGVVREENKKNQQEKKCQKYVLYIFNLYIYQKFLEN